MDLIESGACCCSYDLFAIKFEHKGGEMGADPQASAEHRWNH